MNSIGCYINDKKMVFLKIEEMEILQKEIDLVVDELIKTARKEGRIGICLKKGKKEIAHQKVPKSEERLLTPLSDKKNRIAKQKSLYTKTKLRVEKVSQEILKIPNKKKMEYKQVSVSQQKTSSPVIDKKKKLYTRKNHRRSVVSQEILEMPSGRMSYIPDGQFQERGLSRSTNASRLVSSLITTPPRHQKRDDRMSEVPKKISEKLPFHRSLSVEPSSWVDEIRTKDIQARNFQKVLDFTSGKSSHSKEDFVSGGPEEECFLSLQYAHQNSTSSSDFDSESEQNDLEGREIFTLDL